MYDEELKIANYMMALCKAAREEKEEIRELPNPADMDAIFMRYGADYRAIISSLSIVAILSEKISNEIHDTIRSAEWLP